jgi:hypothetical protein
MHIVSNNILNQMKTETQVEKNIECMRASLS